MQISPLTVHFFSPFHIRLLFYSTWESLCKICELSPNKATQFKYGQFSPSLGERKSILLLDLLVGCSSLEYLNTGLILNAYSAANDLFAHFLSLVQYYFTGLLFPFLEHFFDRLITLCITFSNCYTIQLSFT